MLALKKYAFALSKVIKVKYKNSRKMFSDTLAKGSLLLLCVLESSTSCQAASKNKLHSVHALYLICRSELQEQFKSVNFHFGILVPIP